MLHPIEINVPAEVLQVKVLKDLHPRDNVKIVLDENLVRLFRFESGEDVLIAWSKTTACRQQGL